MNQIHHLALAAALRRADRHPAAPALAQPVFKKTAVFKVSRHVNLGGNERRVEIVLLENGAEEFTGIEGLLVLPEELPLVDHTAAAHVKNRDSQHGFFAVVAE